MSDFSEQLRELRSQLAHQQQLIDHLQELHSTASDRFIGLRDEVREIHGRLRAVENRHRSI